MTAAAKQTPSSHQLQVFYDGSCPLCTREIAFYQRREGADVICWVDVSANKAPEVSPGLSKDQALSRFHVKTEDGTLVSGGCGICGTVDCASRLPSPWEDISDLFFGLGAERSVRTRF